METDEQLRRRLKDAQRIASDKSEHITTRNLALLQAAVLEREIERRALRVLA